jgi:UDP-2,3-diacylglucosamine pyrophosphatase LpxH
VEYPEEAMLTETEGARRYRTIWLSDIHLGTKGCRADMLLDFLRETESDNLFLVGDIVDGWRLTKSWYWPQAHNDVVQKIMRKARKGTQVIYIPGTHDEGFRQFRGLRQIRRGRQLRQVAGDAGRLCVFDGHHVEPLV